MERKQFKIDVFHREAKDISKKAIASAVSKKFKVAEDNVVIFGFRTKFGGMRSSAFCLIYESLDALKRFEPKYRLIRKGLVEKPKLKKTRRTKKEEKNTRKKLWGMEKVRGKKKKKDDDEDED